MRVDIFQHIPHETVGEVRRQFFGFARKVCENLPILKEDSLGFGGFRSFRVGGFGGFRGLGFRVWGFGGFGG